METDRVEKTQETMDVQEENINFFIGLLGTKDLETFKKHMEQKTEAEKSRIVNFVTESGETLLMCAVCKYETQIVEYMLLECGADPNIKAVTCSTPLLCATLGEDLEMITLLVTHGADVNGAVLPLCHPSLRPFLETRRKTHRDCTLELQSIGSDELFDFEEQRETTACLMKAVEFKDPKVYNYLLENGADVNLRNEHGLTALHSAVKYGNLNAVKVLLDHGAEHSWPQFNNNVMKYAAIISEFHIEINSGIDIIEYMIEKTNQSELDIIHAYELFGANLLTKEASYLPDGSLIPEVLDVVCKCWIKTMRLRYKDSFNPLLKSTLEPQMVYCNVREPQTMSELKEVLNKPQDIPVQSMLIFERIFGKNSQIFLDKLKDFITVYKVRLGANPRWFICILQYGVDILEEYPHLIPVNASFYRKLNALVHITNMDEYVQILQSTAFALAKIEEIKLTFVKCYSCNLLNIFVELVQHWVIRCKAIFGDLTDRVDSIIQSVCVLNPTKYRRRSILHAACLNVHQLLIYEPFPFDIFGREDNTLKTLQEYHHVIKYLLERGAKVNYRDIDGIPALFMTLPDKQLSAQYSKVVASIFRLMVSCGAHLDIPSNSHWTSYKKISCLFPQLPKIFKPSLQCLAARVLARNNIPYRDREDVPKLLTPFISVHDADSNNFNL